MPDVDNYSYNKIKNINKSPFHLNNDYDRKKIIHKNIFFFNLHHLLDFYYSRCFHNLCKNEVVFLIIFIKLKIVHIGMISRKDYDKCIC